jgi:hypothetical protein
MTTGRYSILYPVDNSSYATLVVYHQRQRHLRLHRCGDQTIRHAVSKTRFVQIVAFPRQARTAGLGAWRIPELPNQESSATSPPRNARHDLHLLPHATWPCRRQDAILSITRPAGEGCGFPWLLDDAAACSGWRDDAGEGFLVVLDG